MCVSLIYHIRCTISIVNLNSPCHKKLYSIGIYSDLILLNKYDRGENEKSYFDRIKKKRRKKKYYPHNRKDYNMFIFMCLKYNTFVLVLNRCSLTMEIVQYIIVKSEYNNKRSSSSSGCALSYPPPHWTHYFRGMNIMAADTVEFL